MARPKDEKEAEGLNILRVTANILNTQPRTADKGSSSSLVVGTGAIVHRSQLMPARNASLAAMHGSARESNVRYYPT
jgi:hypothetical protein